jgi:hypothetical protein
MITYTYKPIPPSSAVIRLLRLFKGYMSDNIQLELFQASLCQEDCVRYEALSYTWGSEAILEKITLEERDKSGVIQEFEMEITTNLHAALRHLRSPNRDVVLWADAICIDQSSNIEKSYQIRQMRLVYERADQVIIWLGHSDEYIDLLMDSMSWLHKEASTNSDDWKDPTRRPGITGPIFRQQLEDVPTQSYCRQLEALQNLLERPWFQRVWILQEVASARAATVVCGFKSVPAYIFALMPFLLGLEVDSHAQAVLDINLYINKEEKTKEKRTLYYSSINIKCLLRLPRQHII